MKTDSAGSKRGISERFVPNHHTGRLVEVEHISPYPWAAHGRRVLDAGATPHGCLMAEAGAREVVGVGIAKPALDVAGPTMPEMMHLQPGDLRNLSFDDDSRFDLVVSAVLFDRRYEAGDGAAIGEVKIHNLIAVNH